METGAGQGEREDTGLAEREEYEGCDDDDDGLQGTRRASLFSAQC